MNDLWWSVVWRIKFIDVFIDVGFLHTYIRNYTYRIYAHSHAHWVAKTNFRAACSVFIANWSINQASKRTDQTNNGSINFIIILGYDGGPSKGERECVCSSVQWMSAVVHVNRYVRWVENVGGYSGKRTGKIYRNNHIMASFSCMMMMMVWLTVRP